MTYAVLAAWCAHCPPISISTFEPVVLPKGCPIEAVGMNNFGSCTSPRPCPSPMWTPQQLRCWAGARALDALVLPLFFKSTPTISHQLRQHLRCTFPYGLENKQRLRGHCEHMAVGVCAGQTSPGGALSGCYWGAAALRRIAAMNCGAKKAVATRVQRSCKDPKAAGAHGVMEWRFPKDTPDTNICDWDIHRKRHFEILVFVWKFKKIAKGYTMHKHFNFGCPCHIPSMCKHNFFRKDKLVIYLVYDKLPKDANG